MSVTPVTYINEVNQYQDGDLNHAHLYSRVRPDLNPKTEVQRIQKMHFFNTVSKVCYHCIYYLPKIDIIF